MVLLGVAVASAAADKDDDHDNDDVIGQSTGQYIRQ